MGIKYLWELFRRLLGLRAQVVLVFDGPEKPGTKRLVRVSQRAHWMVAPTICLAEAFNFTHHQAPGDAEAELSHLVSEGLIDAVLTADSDTLLFGADILLRSSQDKKKPDEIEVYRQYRLDRMGLTHGGLLLFALVCGGDYDPTVRFMMSIQLRSLLTMM
ncbi:PIN domain-like protein [Schizophyllum commune]